MRGDADQQIGSDAAGIRERKVVLPQVHAIRLCDQRGVHAVVHDQERTAVPSKFADLPQELQEWAVRHVFFADLQDARAARQKR